MALVSGTHFGPYEVLAIVGAGGMGEVYRARDTKLERSVALKVLPDGFASDPDRLARFRREARTLAALNHQHIAAIYGVEESGGITALVLEFVEGPTLAERLTRGALPVGDALATATEIASALEAAHDRGIIHRDLKPANIKLTADGVVKVLDFGLAKALGEDRDAPNVAESPTVTATGTRAGVLLGTAAYMSPEQARGLVVDTRTDVWAFGCVLFELLTGRLAFTGGTVTDVLAAIVSREPDWAALPSDTPPSVRRLLRRCLQKDPKRRLRHIGDARLDLEETNEALPSVAPVSRQRRISAWVPWLVAAAATVIAVALAIRRGPPPSDGFANVTVERVTYDAGLTTMPAISADGRLIAFASDRSGRGDLDIWVQLADGAPIRVTDGPADELSPHFSPDGNQIVYRSEAAGGGVYVVPTLGGEPRLIAPEGRGPRFSPDGSKIAYWVGEFRGGSTAASGAYLVPLGGGEATRLLPDFETARDPVWAPDGKSLLVTALARRAAGRNDVDWWWVPLGGGSPVKTGAAEVAPAKAAIDSTQRSDWTEQGLIFSDGADLWLLPMSPNDGHPTGAARRLTVGAQQYELPSVSRDGRIVFASSVAHRVVGRAPISVAADAPPAARLYEDTRYQGGRTSQTADGSQIVFERAIPNGREIWVRTTAGGSERLVARVNERSLLNATVSPDGSKVAYTAAWVGYVVETTRGVPRRICGDCLLHGFLSDNRRVLVLDPGPGGTTIRLIDLTTSSTHVIVRVAEGALTPAACFARRSLDCIPS